MDHGLILLLVHRRMDLLACLHPKLKYGVNTRLVQEKERAAKKGKKRRQEAGVQQAGAEKEAWEGAHPWRPFDRERDMGASLRPASREDMLKQTGSLTNRFSGGDAAQKRTFL